MWINSGYFPNLRVFNGEAVCFLRGRKWISVYVVGKGKGKIDPRTLHEGLEGEQRYSSTLPLISALHEVGWSTPHLGRFTPGKETVAIVQEVGWTTGPAWRLWLLDIGGEVMLGWQDHVHVTPGTVTRPCTKSRRVSNVSVCLCVVGREFAPSPSCFDSWRSSC